MDHLYYHFRQLDFGDLAFLTGVIGWCHYVCTYWSYDAVEKSLDEEFGHDKKDN